MFKAFESGIFSKLKKSEQSEQSNGDVSFKNISSDLNNIDNKLFTPRKKGTRLKILSPKQMLKRLPIYHTQVEASNNSEHLLN